ncbi:MAG: thiol-activated cytolysin family protein [Myxococcaceae bacterium]|nr:thiol-activated cytolysin family protein [Myxococcaceae bacterium]
MRHGTRVGVFLLAAAGWACASGESTLAATGELEAEPASLQALGEPATEQLVPLDLPANQVDRYRCTTTPVRMAEVRRIAGQPLLVPSADIFPGSLLQGKPFLSGSLTPLTLSRGSGRLHVRGAALPEANTTRSMDMLTSGNVLAAIQDVLGTHGPFQKVTPGLTVAQTYSNAHYLFTLGTDVRFHNESITSALDLDAPRKRNLVGLRFTQTYFTVSFETPDKAVGVFRDRERFDPQGQMAPDNPPLYVSEVAYGRQLFLVADSEYNAAHLEAALRGAFENLPADTLAMPGLTYGQVLARTRIRYALRGSTEGLALQAIDTSEPANRYDAVKGILADKSAASFSREAMGVPISYTLRYLKTNEVARTSFVATFDRRECAFTPTPLPSGTHRFRLWLSNVDDRVRVSRVDAGGQQTLFETADPAFAGWVDLSPGLLDAETELKVELWNEAADTPSSLNLHLQHLTPAGEPTSVVERLYFDPTAPSASPALEASFLLDRVTGGPQNKLLSITP